MMSRGPSRKCDASPSWIALLAVPLLFCACPSNGKPDGGAPDASTGCPDASVESTALFSGPDITTALAVDSTGIYFGAYFAGPGRILKVPLDGGPATTLVSNLQQPAGIALDTSNIYLTDLNAGTVLRAPLQGGTPITLASGQSDPGPILVDDRFVYWATLNDGLLMRVELDGGTPQTLFNTMTSSVTAIALNGNYLYWTDASGVSRLDLDAGTTETVAPNQQPDPSAVAVDNASIYWLISGSDGIDHYYDGAVMKMPKSGGTPTQLTPSLGIAVAIAVDANAIYWADDIVSPDDTPACGQDGAIRKIGLTGGSMTTIARTGHPEALTVDENNIYWTGNDGTGSDFVGTVNKAPK